MKVVIIIILIINFFELFIIILHSLFTTSGSIVPLHAWFIRMYLFHLTDFNYTFKNKEIVFYFNRTMRELMVNSRFF